ncbi:hypothetical protein PULV_a6008 [Pseudoalteromonas ulvae UL12]|nr:hypothetical protein [Pseudoalteromonas ulvae UL12]
MDKNMDKHLVINLSCTKEMELNALAVIRSFDQET